MFMAVVIVMFLGVLVLVLYMILNEVNREAAKEALVVEKLVYLSREEIATLEAVADRIDTFGHQNDALMLKQLIRKVER